MVLLLLVIIEETFRRDRDVFCVREAELARAVGAKGVEGHDDPLLFFSVEVGVSVSVSGSVLWGSIGGVEMVRSRECEED